MVLTYVMFYLETAVAMMDIQETLVIYAQKDFMIQTLILQCQIAQVHPKLDLRTTRFKEQNPAPFIFY